MERDLAVAVLGRLHRAQSELYSGGDESGVRAVLTPDIRWHVPGVSAVAGDHDGIDRVLAYFRRRRDLAGGTFTMTPRDVMTGPGDHVAVLTDGAATIHGREHGWSTVGLYRIRGERVAECWLLPLDPAAFDTIWAVPGPGPGDDGAEGREQGDEG